ncbi:DUF3313 domain-containing protein [Xanthobacter sediminis]
MRATDGCTVKIVRDIAISREKLVKIYFSAMDHVRTSHGFSSCLWRLSAGGPVVALAGAAISASSLACGAARSFTGRVAHARRGRRFGGPSQDEGSAECPLEDSEAGTLKATRCVALLAIVGLVSGCASAELVKGSGLSTYDAMTPADDMFTNASVSVRKEKVLAAKTVRILPTTFAPSVSPKLTDQQRALVANAVDRGLCVSLSDRLEVVPAEAYADLTVRASVTQMTETNELAAGVSAAASIGMNFIDLGVPVPTPRIPIGLGSLSMEAEAVDPAGHQEASMLWGKGANALFSSPRMSKAGDAYSLAEEFGGDFGILLVKGESPFGSPGINLPSWQKINSAMGLPPKYAACERYGRYPGLVGVIGDQLGLPPEWTDSGAKQAAAH